MSDPVISLQGVWKYFGDFPAVRDVSFDIPSGTILALLGRNGAGKTTVLRMMAGLLRSSRGQIRVNPSDGQEANGRGSIGMVGHGEWIYDDLTAEENLAFFARLYRAKDAPRKIDYWLETTGLERFRRSRQPSSLAACASAWRSRELFFTSRTSCCWMSRGQPWMIGPRLC